MDNSRYMYNMTIGDWSDDGHSESVNFVFFSNKPIEDVREAHYRIKEVTGIDIENICSDYDEDWIDDDIFEQIVALGFEFDDDSMMPSEHELAKLWAFLLNQVDPELSIRVLTDLERIHFHGFDEKRRHIGSVGYGLFC